MLNLGAKGVPIHLIHKLTPRSQFILLRAKRVPIQKNFGVSYSSPLTYHGDKNEIHN